MRELLDWVAFVGVDDHLRFDVGGLQGSIEHAAHWERAAAVVGGMEDQGRRLHSRCERKRAVVAHQLRDFPGEAAEFPFGPALDVGQAPHDVEIGDGVLRHGGSELVRLADQRAGRAGRTQSGACIRLWDEVSHRARSEQTEPEIKRVDLASPLLQLLAMGETNPLTFPWLNPPAESALARAWEILTALGFLTDNRLSPDGALAARFPVHPRLSRLLISDNRTRALENHRI